MLGLYRDNGKGNESCYLGSRVYACKAALFAKEEALSQKAGGPKDMGSEILECRQLTFT